MSVEGFREAVGRPALHAAQPHQAPEGLLGKPASFPLRPERVVEVRYDHMEGPRFRHTTQFVRWRTDRDPLSCTFAQLQEPVRFDLEDILGS